MLGGNIITGLAVAVGISGAGYGMFAEVQRARLETKMLEQRISLQQAQANEAAAVADLQTCAIAATNIQEALQDNAEFSDLPEFGDLDPGWLRGPKPDDNQDTGTGSGDA